jgi:ABC-type Fe3+ transport system permease subunit
MGYGLVLTIFLCGPLMMLLYRAVHVRMWPVWKMLLSGSGDTVVNVSIYRLLSNSVMIAMASSVLSVMFATILALMHHKSSKICGFLAHMTPFLPLIVGGAGIGIIIVAAQNALGISRLMSVTLCHAFLNCSLAYSAVQTQLLYYDDQMSLLAHSFGATSWQVIRLVLIPFLLPVVRKALCLSFCLSMGEVGIRPLPIDTSEITMPLALRIYYQNDMIDHALCIGLVLSVFIVISAFMMKRP